ncbi:MAG: family 43 glycosylhydrolase, partial [Myxococcales bacterium]|nr:family 43 glycosylhydrolase [Myxococcales bacterium]
MRNGKLAAAIGVLAFSIVPLAHAQDVPNKPGAGDGTQAFSQDFPDPFVFRVDDTYYAYGTNTTTFHGTVPPGSVTWSNVPVLRSTDGMKTWVYTGDALPTVPSTWVAGPFTPFTWAPSVLKRITPLVDLYVLYFVGRHQATGVQCVGTAFGATPYDAFTASPTPIVCPGFGGLPAASTDGGAIDASPFIDQDGTAYLLWKNDGNNSSGCGLCQTKLWIAPLSSDGTALDGPPTELIAYGGGWETPLIENPVMYYHEGLYYLFYSANGWDTPNYAEGYATCTTPTGPCAKQTTTAPWMASYGDYAGPGGVELVREEWGEVEEP